MKYNVETNKVETEITMVTNALEAMKKAEERKMENAKNYKKIYGETECVKFEIEMWKKGIKLNSTLFSKDENGLYKEYSWE